VRIFLIIIACLGLLLVFLAAAPASFTTQDFIRQSASYGHQLGGFGIQFLFFWGWYPAALGALLALVGGLIARPRFLWIPLVAVGLIHILSFTGLYVYYFRAVGLESHLVLLTLYTMAPGLLCIIEGLIIREHAVRRRASA
jgi:hypothetical protein